MWSYCCKCLLSKQWPNNCISWGIYFTVGEIALHWSIIFCSIKGKVKASFSHSKKDSTNHGIKIRSYIWFTNVTKEKMKWLTSLKTDNLQFHFVKSTCKVIMLWKSTELFFV